MGTIGESGLDPALFKQLGLVVCFSIFLAIGLRLAFVRRGKYDRAARLPLEDDAGEGGKGGPDHG